MCKNVTRVYPGIAVTQEVMKKSTRKLQGSSEKQRYANAVREHHEKERKKNVCVYIYILYRMRGKERNLGDRERYV